MALQGEMLSVIREHMINQAAGLLIFSPGQDEYVRGMVELIVNSTLAEGEDADSLRVHVENTIALQVYQGEGA